MSKKHKQPVEGSTALLRGEGFVDATVIITDVEQHGDAPAFFYGWAFPSVRRSPGGAPREMKAEWDADEGVLRECGVST